MKFTWNMFQEVYGPHRYKHLRKFFRNKLSLFIKLKSSLPKDAFCKVGWNWPSGSGEEDYKISSISPLGERKCPLFEKTWIPFSQGFFVSGLVEIGPVVLEKKIFQFRPCIFAISLLSPLGKGWGPPFELTLIPITQKCFVPSLVEIGRVVLEKKMKMWKVYRQTDSGREGRTTVSRQTEKLTWAFSSDKLKRRFFFF